MSLAVSLAVAATASGSWLAVVGVPTFGLEAAEEFGIPLERVVGVDPGDQRAVGESWAELVGATFDGFEVVITKVPRRLNAVLARRVQAPPESSRSGADHARCARTLLRRRRVAGQRSALGGRRRRVGLPARPAGRRHVVGATCPAPAAGVVVAPWPRRHDRSSTRRCRRSSPSPTITLGDDAESRPASPAHGVVGALAGRRRGDRRRCPARPSRHRARCQPCRRLFGGSGGGRCRSRAAPPRRPAALSRSGAPRSPPRSRRPRRSTPWCAPSTS